MWLYGRRSMDMHYDITFPILVLQLDHVGKDIDVFGFKIAYYGMIIGAAILIGFLIAIMRRRGHGRTRKIIWIWGSSG